MMSEEVQQPSGDERLRVAIVQPAVPSYRVPVFRELARDPRIRLRVLSAHFGGVPEANPDGYDYAEAAHRSVRGSLIWIGDELRLSQRKDVDVLVLPWNTRILSTIPALLIARFRGTRTVLWGHGYSRRGPGRLRDLLRNALARMADAVVAYDFQTAETLARSLDRSKLFVAPNALDQDPIEAERSRLAANPHLMEDFRCRNHLAQRRVILHVSRLIPARKLEVLLEALPEVVRQVPEALLVVIGDGPAKAQLMKAAAELGVPDAVMFLRSTYDEAGLGPWFHEAAAYCFPEGLGLSLFHALGYGTPVVLGDNLDLHWPEARSLTLGVNAIGFRHGDSRHLAEVLVLLLSDSDLRSSIAGQGRQLVVEHYNLKTMVEGLTAALLAEPKRAS